MFYTQISSTLLVKFLENLTYHQMESLLKHVNITDATFTTLIVIYSYIQYKGFTFKNYDNFVSRAKPRFSHESYPVDFFDTSTAMEDLLNFY